MVVQLALAPASSVNLALHRHYLRAQRVVGREGLLYTCLLYTSDAADE